MENDIEVWNTLISLREAVDVLEAKMDEIYMRPRMPYSQNGSIGDKLKLDALKQPEWTT